MHAAAGAGVLPADEDGRAGDGALRGRAPGLRFGKTLAAAGAAALALGAAVWHAASFLAAPAGAPQPADCIVALGGDSGDRIVTALDLYRRGYAPLILLTGVEDSPGDTRRAYLTWRAEYLVKAGVPPAAILYDGWKRVMVVSDPPHMRRLARAWGKAFAGTGKNYILVATAPAWWRERAWWQSERAVQFVLTEYVKLGYYLARY
ncbi:MAG: YdcF family protein [Betaproteobacteria bacterium]|nr:MAG: YdcF family protein [Betaproteobacteria bacterium]